MLIEAFTIILPPINDDMTVFLDELLGKGAFGAVFKGSYKGEYCAVKVLLHDAMEMQASIPVGKNEEAGNALIVRVIFSSRSSTQTLFGFCRLLSTPNQVVQSSLLS